MPFRPWSEEDERRANARQARALLERLNRSIETVDAQINPAYRCSGCGKSGVRLVRYRSVRFCRECGVNPERREKLIRREVERDVRTT